jgi:hypothetical protein
LSLFLWASVLAMSACACSLPVFRFALDRWSADNFRLQVSEPEAADPAVSKFLRNFGADSGLNLEIERKPEGPSRLLRPRHGDATETEAWRGKVTEARLQNLGQSPLSVEIIQRLLAGDSAVWVLVESGNTAQNDAAAAKLQKRLAYLQQAIEIPAADPNDLSSRPGPGPALTVCFSLVRIPPADGGGDDAEALLRAGLAGPQSGLAPSKEPWFATVFGRGRVLGAWPTAEFEDEQIDEVCLFLSGACSCQVKRQNPGWDLLLKVDWEERLRSVAREREHQADAPTASPTTPVPSAGGATPPPPSKSPAPENPGPESVRFDPNPAPQTKEPIADKIVALPLAALGAFLLVFSLRRRSKSSRQ